MVVNGNRGRWKNKNIEFEKKKFICAHFFYTRYRILFYCFLYYFQACAPRYVYFTINGNRKDPVGTCYVTKDFNDFSEYSPCRTRK